VTGERGAVLLEERSGGHESKLAAKGVGVSASHCWRLAESGGVSGGDGNGTSERRERHRAERGRAVDVEVHAAFVVARIKHARSVAHETTTLEYAEAARGVHALPCTNRQSARSNILPRHPARLTYTDIFIAELESEVEGSRRALAQVPEKNRDWKPHEKSMPLGYLTSMVAAMPSWIGMMVTEDELDVAPATPKHQPPGNAVHCRSDLGARGHCAISTRRTQRDE
jgi:hypothetical protein